MRLTKITNKFLKLDLSEHSSSLKQTVELLHSPKQVETPASFQESCSISQNFFSRCIIQEYCRTFVKPLLSAKSQQDVSLFVVPGKKYYLNDSSWSQR